MQIQEQHLLPQTKRSNKWHSLLHFKNHGNRITDTQMQKKKKEADFIIYLYYNIFSIWNSSNYIALEI